MYDYWHTSPNFFLMRCGILLIILFCVYAWCRWGLAQMGFSPVIQLGKTSLLVYWVHIEFVYGRLSILPKHQAASFKPPRAFSIIFLAMLVLSLSAHKLEEPPCESTNASRRAIASLKNEFSVENYGK